MRALAGSEVMSTGPARAMMGATRRTRAEENCILIVGEVVL